MNTESTSGRAEAFTGSELAGVIPITATPFDAGGRVDEESIVTLVEFEARCGVHGLNVLGIMGEFLRKEVLRLRGAIRSSHVRAPGPELDDVTRAELLAILRRTGLLAR